MKLTNKSEFPNFNSLALIFFSQRIKIEAQLNSPHPRENCPLHVYRFQLYLKLRNSDLIIIRKVLEHMSMEGLKGRKNREVAD